jgi:hypothetical protein
MSDLLHQNFSTVQSKQQPAPVTLAAAATIAPSTFITFVSGTTAVANVTPPVTGQHMLVLIFTDSAAGTFVTTGNVMNAIVPTQNLPTFLFYDPAQGKYYGCASNVT